MQQQQVNGVTDYSMLNGIPVNGFDFPSWEVGSAIVV
jgi:hypothetical protein